ncbi:MAG: hypothetical protein ACREJ9_13960 [Candidatus Rokuibacteriota bacterium]
MKTAFVFAGVLAAALALAPGQALAWSSHGGPGPSVFPRPVDPWRHWGHHHFHHHPGFTKPGFTKPGFSQPGFHHPGFTVIVPPRGHHVVPPVWIPGAWAWNGAVWVWVPGHWARF